MRFGVAAFALFAGCSFPHSEPGSNGGKDGSTDTPTIDARVIDAAVTDMPITTTDAPPDTPPPMDTDGDGFADSSDNCPLMANPNQRDHDGDGKGDVCDYCPHLMNAADPDGDGDGVGDACDPRPATAGDSRALFEGFYDATSIANWTASGGNWAVANGVLTQSISTASNNTNTLSPPLTVTRAAVTAKVTVIALGNPNGGGDTPHVSVASGVANNQSYWCSVVDEGNSDKVYASVFRPFMAPSFPNTNWNGTFAAMSELRLTLALLGNDNACTVVQGTTIATISGDTGSTNGGVEVATRTASASFDYVFVVSIGN